MSAVASAKAGSTPSASPERTSSRAAEQKPDWVCTPTAPSDNTIQILNAREHNLKHTDITIPRDAFTVITGLSGSGKSTVAFDILYNEGQRRYLESLNAYARQFVQPAARPEVDAVTGVPPTVAIEQRISRGGLKSTVATVTEIYHYLRLMFVKLGVQHCPECALPIEPQSLESILTSVKRRFKGRRVEVSAPLVTGRKGYYADLAKWAQGKGFAHLRVDGQLLETAAWPRLDRYREHDIDLPVGHIQATPAKGHALCALIEQALSFGDGAVRIATASRDGGISGSILYSTVRACPGCGKSFPELDPRLFSFNSKQGWCPACYGTGVSIRGFDAEQTGEEEAWLGAADGETVRCPACHGQRLRPEALAVQLQKRSINTYTGQSIDKALAAFASMRLPQSQSVIATDLLAELLARLQFMQHVGLGYLTLDRAVPTLSGGEAQRIRLASQLGSNLRGVCYVLDEPTIGLHARDNEKLLATLRQLQQKGNTIVVVEHDEETIRQADHVIDLGPGAGIEGGRVVATGTPTGVMADPNSVTGRYLKSPLVHPLGGKRRPCGANAAKLTVCQATLHNLKSLTVDIPLERLVCVSGVSGSGKSTLVRDVLLESLRAGMAPLARGGKRRRGARAAAPSNGCAAIEGREAITRVLEVDQTPIGRTPRSCPATYVGFWDRIRALFAATPEARMRGYNAARFSFNTGEGRCPECKGNGYQTVEMSFLPNVSVLCEACGGRRFTEETCQVTYQGFSIADVLALSVNEAVDVFAAHREIHRALRLLQDVGLGYLTLGQRSPTLSGGEAQRIKLVTELARSGRQQGVLVVLDEPTIGLHMGDVANLIHVLQRLVEAGASVILIEHNLDLIAEADWVIDLGPEGGDRGGRLVGAGTPERIARLKRSHTGQFLKPLLSKSMS